jgi:hypothetical protein
VGALLQNFDILVVLGGYLLKVLWVLEYQSSEEEHPQHLQKITT